MPHKGATRLPIFVLVWAPKGGVGKTTLCYGLAVTAARSGRRVAGIDLDRQRAFERWSRTRQDNPVFDKEDAAVHARFYAIKEWPRAFREASEGGAEVVIIDTPPSPHDDENAELMRLASKCNVVLVPTEPYPQSLDFTAELAFVLRKLHVPFRFVLNGIDERRIILREAVERLAAHGTVAAARIPRRDNIALTYQVGGAPADDVRLPGHEAFRDLWREVEVIASKETAT